MNTELNIGADCYGLFSGEEIIGFYSVLHFPHPNLKNMKKGHRLVILPDYQGIGLGSKFKSFVAGLYVAKGYRFRSTMSAKNLIYAHKNSKDWKCIRWGFAPKEGRTAKESLRGIHRIVKTATFEYIGKPTVTGT